MGVLVGSGDRIPKPGPALSATVEQEDFFFFLPFTLKLIKTHFIVCIQIENFKKILVDFFNLNFNF